MSRYNRDPEEIWRDLLTAWWHPQFDGTPTIQALKEIKRQRHEHDTTDLLTHP